MYPLLLSIFSVSLVSIAILIAIKLRSIATGKDILSPLLDHRIEYHAREIVVTVEHIVQLMRVDRRRLLIASYFVLRFSLRLVEKLREVLQVRLIKVLNMIKGKRNATKRGAVSVYLRDISEYKHQLRS